MLDVQLKPGRERAVARRHPWVLSGAVADVRGKESALPGAFARVVAANGVVLGFGHHSPASNIRVRMLTFGPDAPDADLLPQRIALAVARRARDPLLGQTDALRLVNTEGDDLPGLVVDRYAETIVVKLSTAGMALRRDEIVSALREATGASCGYERADATGARREGLPTVDGPLWGTAPGAPVPIRERDRRYAVDVAAGQKTGFYLDQRDARDLVGTLAAGRRVLDLFSYTGGFAVAAALGGAVSVTLVDSSSAARDRAVAHLEDNAPSTHTVIHKADAFGFLREPAGQGPWDVIVVDPPPLARRHADVTRASRAYKDLMLHALLRAAPGAHVLAFACSHHVGPEALQSLAYGAALDAQRGARVLSLLGAPSDHPISIFHPEGRYLTGLLLEVC